jgi:hypothetical protein
MPVGALFLGMLAEHPGKSPAVVITAVCSLAVTVLVLYRFPVISTLE